MSLTPVVGGRVACVRAALALSAVPRPHLYPIPQHTPSLMTHATNDTPHRNSDDDFLDSRRYDFADLYDFSDFFDLSDFCDLHRLTNARVQA